ncbi:hypothetical protein Goklo_002289 [Gossypium klotzschianum]|uniref:Uncharacterized protein n=1 Tax=Gossypium klotzschianum TaxID=34286 RepID=A0A7J8VTN7_9ROSI|nr:hypothetical protein [Gossypium klotzschianum]
MLSTIDEYVGKLEESMEDAKELDNTLGESIEDLREQSRDFVTMCLISQRDSVQELLDFQRKKLIKRNDALEAMVKALKEETMATTMALSIRIEELEGELALCQAAMGKGVANATLSYRDILKPKEFVGTRFAFDVDYFLWRIENYFRAKVRGKDLNEDVVDGNGNGDSSGNGKPRVRKKKPKRKRDKLKCFLCDGLYMLKKCLKKFVLKEKPVGKALVLGSSTKSVEVEKVKNKEPKKLDSSKGKAEAQRVKRSKKKRVKCFLCRGPHEL